MIDFLFFVDFAAVETNDFLYPALDITNNRSDCNVDFDDSGY